MSTRPTKSPTTPSPESPPRAILGGKSETAGLELLFLLSTCLFLAYRFKFCFSSDPFQSVDLHPHVELSRKMAFQLSQGRIFFYDPSQFSGWVVSLFYPTLAHVVAAVIAIPLGSFSSDPIRLAVQGLLGLSLSTLPISLRFALRGLSGTLRGCGYLSSICSLWFLSLPLSSQGIGGDAAIAAGLYPQVLAWAPFLWAIGLASTTEGRLRLFLPIVLAALMLLHPITALAGIFVCCLLMLFKQNRKLCLQMGALSVALPLFWLLPFSLAAKDWLPVHPIASNPSLFPLLFQGSSYLNREGQKEWLWIFLALSLALGLLLSVFPRPKKEKTSFLLSLSLLFGMIFLQSDFLLEHLGGSFHSYRLSGPLALLGIVLATTASLSFLQAISSRVMFCCLLPLALLLFSRFPESLAEKNLSLFREESALSENFSRLLQRREGRTYFEYLGLSEADRHPSPHFLFSRSSRNIETLNGLFLQSSLSHRFIDWTARNLGISTYGLPNIMGDAIGFSAEELLAGFAPFRLNTLVVGSERNILPLGNVQGMLRKNDGVYTLLKVPENLRTSTDRPLLAYWDKNKTLPFQFLEYFFFTDAQLSQRYDVVEIDGNSPLPRRVSGVLINSPKNENDMGDTLKRISVGTPFLNFDFRPETATNILHGEFAPEEAKFLQIRSFLRELLHLPHQLEELSFEKLPRALPLDVRFDEREQRIYFRGTPSVLSILPYSASPGWNSLSPGSSVMRAYPERLADISEKDEEMIQFSYWHLRGSRSGFLLSVLAFSLWMFFVRKESSHEMQ